MVSQHLRKIVPCKQMINFEFKQFDGGQLEHILEAGNVAPDGVDASLEEVDAAVVAEDVVAVEDLLQHLAHPE